MGQIMCKNFVSPDDFLQNISAKIKKTSPN